MKINQKGYTHAPLLRLKRCNAIRLYGLLPGDSFLYLLGCCENPNLEIGGYIPLGLGEKEQKDPREEVKEENHSDIGFRSWKQNGVREKCIKT